MSVSLRHRISKPEMAFYFKRKPPGSLETVDSERPLCCFKRAASVPCRQPIPTHSLQQRRMPHGGCGLGLPTTRNQTQREALLGGVPVPSQVASTKRARSSGRSSASNRRTCTSTCRRLRGTPRRPPRSSYGEHRQTPEEPRVSLACRRRGGRDSQREDGGAEAAGLRRSRARTNRPGTRRTTTGRTATSSTPRQVEPRLPTSSW